MFRRVFFVLCFVFIFPFSASAQTENLVINRFQLGGATTTDEFIEIANPTGEPVNVKGWRLSKKTETGNLTNLLTEFPDFTIPANGVWIIAHKNYTGIADCYYSTSSSVASDNTIILFSDGGETVVDKVGLGKAGDYETAPAENPADGHVVSRINFEDTDNNQKDFGSAEEPPAEEPRDEAEPPVLSVTSYNLIITELMPNPVGTDTQLEWIEIYNQGERVDLGGLILADKFGKVGKYYFPAGTIVETGAYYKVESKTSKISLNNDGDVLELIAAGGELIDSTEVNYGNAKEGLAFALKGNEWFWTTSPTPGSANKIEAPKNKLVTSKTSPKATKKTASKKQGNVLGAVNETDVADDSQNEQMEKNDQTLGIILIVVALLGGLIYTFYMNKEKLGAVFIKERKRYYKSWETIWRKIKRG